MSDKNVGDSPNRPSEIHYSLNCPNQNHRMLVPVSSLRWFPTGTDHASHNLPLQPIVCLFSMAHLPLHVARVRLRGCNTNQCILYPVVER